MSSQRRRLVRSLLIIVLIILMATTLKFVADLILHTYFKSLLSYIPYVDDITTAVSVGAGGYLVVRVVLGQVDRYLLSRRVGRFQGIRLVLEVLLYVILVIAVLVSLGVNLTGAVVGGTVGGIVVGLAVQTVASNVLSGILATWSGAVQPGEVMNISSWIWGSPVVGKVVKVNSLFTEVQTVNGNLVKLPNSAFLGNSTFSALRGSEELLYSTQVVVYYDVRADKVLRGAVIRLRETLREKGVKFEVYLTSKSGTANTFTVNLKFKDFRDLNGILSVVNLAFDDAYWEAKGVK